jgi:alpha-tubulin suppressor-like RCC1 family protein
VFREVSAGGHFTCGLTVDNLAWCWGYSRDGALGAGPEVTQSDTPVRVKGGHRFLKIDAGWDYACGLTPAHGAFCWGSNWYDELGDGTSKPRFYPTRVAGGLVFRDISANRSSGTHGGHHTCGLTTDSLVYCWGNNESGQLGRTTGNDENGFPLSPKPVLVSGGRRFLAVSAGGGHTCGRNLNSLAFCWGYNGLGGLGDGTTASSTLPVRVHGAGLRFSQLSAGGKQPWPDSTFGDFGGSTCGIATSGLAYCWGGNEDGQLGDGTTIPRLTPRAVASTLKFRRISVGEAHTCAISAAGKAYCWGGNFAGMLGDGSGKNQLRASAVVGRLTFAQISAGQSHTCGVTTAGAAYCWGWNQLGELGDGTGQDRAVPTPVVGPR